MVEENQKYLLYYRTLTTSAETKKVEVKLGYKISSEEINKLVQTNASWLVETLLGVFPTP